MSINKFDIPPSGMADSLLMDFTYFIEQGRRGGKKSARRLGKKGLSDRAKRGWATRRKARKANGKQARGVARMAQPLPERATTGR